MNFAKKLAENSQEQRKYKEIIHDQPLLLLLLLLAGRRKKRKRKRASACNVFYSENKVTQPSNFLSATSLLCIFSKLYVHMWADSPTQKILYL